MDLQYKSSHRKTKEFIALDKNIKHRKGAIKMLNNIPYWVVEIVNSYECPQCDNPMVSGNIIAIGIRNSHKDKNITALFILYQCSFCDNSLNLEIQPCDLDDFIDIMIEAQEEHLLDDDAETNIVDIFSDENNEDVQETFEKQFVDNHIDEEDSCENKDIVKSDKKYKKIFSSSIPKDESKISEAEIKEFKMNLDSISNKNDLLKNFGVILKERIDNGKPKDK